MADSNAEWLLNSIYICWRWAAMHLKSRAHGFLSVSLAASTGKGMQMTHRRSSVFIVYIYSHGHILLRQGSQTHLLTVTRYWPGVITREWWGLVWTGELMPHLRCSHLTTYRNVQCCQIIPFSRRCSNFRCARKLSWFWNTVCQVKHVFGGKSDPWPANLWPPTLGTCWQLSVGLQLSGRPQGGSRATE